jgi:hypothetical protein
VVVGALSEDSSTTGVNSTPDNSATDSGAAYIYTGFEPAPSITNVSPPTGSITGGTSVTLSGTNFTGATSVTFGGTPALSFSVNSATSITATTPAHAAGVVNVSVTTSGGIGTGLNLFSYGEPDIALEAPSGTAVANGAGTLAFSSIASGQSSDQAVTVRNVGNVELTSISAALTGTDAEQIALFTTPPTSLAAGASAVFTIRFVPTSLGPKTATLSIASNDPDESPFIINLTGTGATSGAIFNDWCDASGLFGAYAAPDATPFDDGVENILKYAFNMNAGGPDVGVLAPGGSSGLPKVSLDQSGQQPVLRVEFLRRKGSGLIYTPQRSTTIGGFVSMTGTQTVTPIDSNWERVVVEETTPLTTQSFARVAVGLPRTAIAGSNFDAHTPASHPDRPRRS